MAWRYANRVEIEHPRCERCRAEVRPSEWPIKRGQHTYWHPDCYREELLSPSELITAKLMVTHEIPVKRDTKGAGKRIAKDIARQRTELAIRDGRKWSKGR